MIETADGHTAATLVTPLVHSAFNDYAFMI